MSFKKILKLEHDKELDHSIIHVDGFLEPESEYLLSIDFNGFLADDLAGFYKIKYEQSNSSEPM